jgi:hypothetical protein
MERRLGFDRGKDRTERRGAVLGWGSWPEEEEDPTGGTELSVAGGVTVWEG